jgi:hypothetical protein
VGRVETSQDEEALPTMDIGGNICEQVLECGQGKIVMANAVSVEAEICLRRG